MRFHVNSVPHTATNKQWNACAFTMKVYRLCEMLMSKGHHVIHYGHEDSNPICTEHVTVTTKDDWHKAYGDYDWHTNFFKFDVNDHCYQTYFKNTIQEVQKRKQPNDFLLCGWGAGVKPVADAHPDLIAVEEGIGYSGGHFAQFKCFESYSLFHAYHGLKCVAEGGHIHNYSVVIPNHFDLRDFRFQKDKADYILYLGRITLGKGVDVAIDAAKRANVKLVVAGQGNPKEIGMTDWPSHVEYVGYADVEKRKELMANAKALVVMATYAEPFGGVSIEAMLSGTPVITSNYGAYAENVLHGQTGYRCNTMGQIVWAMQNIGQINTQTCYDWASKNFSMERVAEMYEQYWYDVMNVYTCEGWYEPHHRSNLDWLTRYYP